VVIRFLWEGIAWQTVYSALNIRKNGQSILCDTHLGPPSSWITHINEKLKKLVNHRKGVSQRKSDYKFHKNQRTTSITGTSTFNLCTFWPGLTILKRQFMREDARPQRSQSWLAESNRSWKILTQIFYKALN
jgi:hypothetical protein